MKEKLINIGLNLWSKIPQKAKDFLTRLYSNKRVFWPITIAFGLIFLMLIAGLLFGNRNRTTTSVKNSPSPTPQNQNVVPEDNDPLSQIEQKLSDLKNQISTFDAKQSRLQPPTVNYNVKF